MNPNPGLSRTLSILLTVLLGFTSAQAATLTWDADSATGGVQEGIGNWTIGSARFWNGTANVATANNLTTDIARFGNGGVLDEAAIIDADTQSINGLIFGTTTTSGYTLSSENDSILTVGVGGIVINSGAQTTILSSGNLTVALGNQIWTNNSTNPLTLEGLVDGTGKQLTVSGAGPVTFAAGFSNFGLNSIFNAGTNVNITADSTVTTALFANGNTNISAGATDSPAQFLVINNTGHLTVSDEGILTGALLRIGSTSGQAANLTVTGTGQVTAGSNITFNHGGGTVASNLNLKDGGTFMTAVGFTTTGVGAVNFDGGILQLTSNLVDLKVSGAAGLNLNVVSGAIIDVAPGVTVGVSSVLAHAGAPATDGGLTKSAFRKGPHVLHWRVCQSDFLIRAI